MNKNKTIIIMLDNLKYGGLQKTAMFIANACLESYDTVYMITLEQSKRMYEVNNSIIIENLHYSRTSNKVCNTFNMLKSVMEFKKKLKLINPDLICTLGSVSLFVASVASLFKQIKIVGSERNSPEFYNFIWKRLNKFLYSSCDGAVFQTKCAMNFYGEKVSSKSVVIPNAYIIREKAFTILHGEREKIITAAAARFEYKKGFDVLISAFGEVIKKHPEYKLIIYGQGELFDEYVAQVKKLNIEKSVEFPGITSDVAKAVCNSAVFVLPSRYEGIPNVLLEVMGVGVPTVSCDCSPGGPRLLTDNGRCGLLIPIENPKIMAESICDLIENKKLSEEISQNGIKHIHAFSQDKISSMWIDFFEKILKI